MPDTLIRSEIYDGVAVVTLNRPDSLNALSSSMRIAVVEAINGAGKDEKVKVIVLTGAGRAFCAGLDLNELSSGESDSQELIPGNNLVEAFRNLEKPVIGAINGFAITGGFELALMCDILIASESAKFADTHCRVGVVPGWGLSQKLPRIIGVGRAKQLSFTGNFLDAELAEKWGLVNSVVSPDELLPTCLELAREITTCEAKTLRTVKKIIDEGYHETLSDGLRIEAEASREHMSLLTAESLEERREGVMERGRLQN